MVSWQNSPLSQIPNCTSSSRQNSWIPSPAHTVSLEAWLWYFMKFLSNHGFPSLKGRDQVTLLCDSVGTQRVRQRLPEAARERLASLAAWRTRTREGHTSRQKFLRVEIHLSPYPFSDTVIHTTSSRRRKPAQQLQEVTAARSVPACLQAQ